MSGATLPIDLTSPHSESPRPRKRMKAQGRERQRLESLASPQVVIDLSNTPGSENGERPQRPAEQQWSPPHSADSSLWGEMAPLHDRISDPAAPYDGASHAEAHFSGRPATAPGSPHLSMHHASASAQSPAVQSPFSDVGREAFLRRLKSMRSGQPENRSSDGQPAARSTRWDEAPCHPAAASDAGDDEVAILSSRQFEAEAAARAASALHSRTLVRSQRQRHLAAAAAAHATHRPSGPATSEDTQPQPYLERRAQLERRRQQQDIESRSTQRNQERASAAAAARDRMGARREANVDLQRAMMSQQSLQHRLAALMHDNGTEYQAHSDIPSWAMHAPCTDSNDEEEDLDELAYPDPYARFMGFLGDDDGAAPYINQQEWETQNEMAAERAAAQCRMGRNITTDNHSRPGRRDRRGDTAGGRGRSRSTGGGAQGHRNGSGSGSHRAREEGGGWRQDHYSHEMVLGNIMSMLAEQDSPFGRGRCGGSSLAMMRAAMAGMAHDTRLPPQLLYTDRDFDENDYEALLALDDTVENRKGASQSAIDKLEVVTRTTVRTGNAKGEEPRCPICLADYETGASLRRLPCKHQFHKGCVDEWLLRKATCPICAQKAA